MKILVTGAKGMLGQDLCPILEDADFVDEVVETDIDNLDITNKFQVEKVIKEENPDVVIHCAAYTNVEKAEEEQELANKINVFGTKNVAQACKSTDATMILISTDYVFDGEKGSKYLPSDDPNPLNVYGQTKFEAEKLVRQFCEKYYVIRTSWLYGHHGKNFIETMINLVKDGKELKVVNDQIGCPTWTVELSEAICDLLEEKPEYGIYHICGSGETSWYEFAKEIFKQANIKAKILPCSSVEYKTKAKRPKYSVMENNGVCSDWKKSLKSYINLRID
ncbi:dTDP-4-dehydrorhamnose reductase [bacterium]|nr:dTDP-4-dehydrorhamnose reductase [bacterium]